MRARISALNNSCWNLMMVKAPPPNVMVSFGAAAVAPTGDAPRPVGWAWITCRRIPQESDLGAPTDTYPRSSTTRDNRSLGSGTSRDKARTSPAC